MSDQGVAETYTTRNKSKIRTFMPWAWIEPAIAAIKRPQTHALDCIATGNLFTIDLLTSIGFVILTSCSHYDCSSQIIRPTYCTRRSALRSKSPTTYSSAGTFNLALFIIRTYSTEIRLNVTISSLTLCSKRLLPYSVTNITLHTSSSLLTGLHMQSISISWWL